MPMGATSVFSKVVVQRGETGEELAASFLQQMLDGGYARKL
jgi:hypothetical protein